MPSQEAFFVLGKFRKKERDTVCTVSLLSYCSLRVPSNREEGWFHLAVLRYHCLLRVLRTSFFALLLRLLGTEALKPLCFLASNAGKTLAA